MAATCAQANYTDCHVSDLHNQFSWAVEGEAVYSAPVKGQNLRIQSPVSLDSDTKQEQNLGPCELLVSENLICSSAFTCLKATFSQILTTCTSNKS